VDLGKAGVEAEVMNSRFCLLGFVSVGSADGGLLDLVGNRGEAESVPLRRSAMYVCCTNKQTKLSLDILMSMLSSAQREDTYGAKQMK
jgi:hypothetical protein